MSTTCPPPVPQARARTRCSNWGRSPPVAGGGSTTSTWQSEESSEELCEPYLSWKGICLRTECQLSRCQESEENLHRLLTKCANLLPECVVETFQLDSASSNHKDLHVSSYLMELKWEAKEFAAAISALRFDDEWDDEDYDYHSLLQEKLDFLDWAEKEIKCALDPDFRQWYRHLQSVYPEWRRAPIRSPAADNHQSLTYGSVESGD